MPLTVPPLSTLNQARPRFRQPAGRRSNSGDPSPASTLPLVAPFYSKPLREVEAKVPDNAPAEDALRSDGLLAKLHEIQILGIAGGGLEDDLVERGAATKQQPLLHFRVRINLHQRAGQHQILLDLGRRGPGTLLRPLGNRQCAAALAERRPPPCGAARTRREPGSSMPPQGWPEPHRMSG